MTVDFHYLNAGRELVYSYAPQFGFFFLLAIIGLIFFQSSRRLYLLLMVFHLLVEIIAVMSTYLGVKGFMSGFMAADFLLLYLSPLVSLGFIFVAHQNKKAMKKKAKVN